LSENLSIQVGVFPKSKTGKHKGEIQTHQRRKNWKAKKSKQQKQKTNIHRSASENLMQQSPEILKESRKIMNDGKTVLLMVLWVRVDSDPFISLLSI
jgi:hypothetical protein